MSEKFDIQAELDRLAMQELIANLIVNKIKIGKHKVHTKEIKVLDVQLVRNNQGMGHYGVVTAAIKIEDKWYKLNVEEIQVMM